MLGLNHAANLGVTKRQPHTSAKRSRAGHNIGMLGMIWAQDKNGVLGANGGMLWRVPADFKHFKEVTWGHPVIMGRASFLALGAALPSRRNIVLSRTPGFSAPDVEVADSLESALKLCAGQPEVWITGGGGVYREAMPLADLLAVTELDLEASLPPGADVTYAPAIDSRYWRLDASRSDTDWRERSGDAAWRVKYYLASS